jgi:hypothetical protein
MAGTDDNQTTPCFPAFNYDPTSTTLSELCDQCLALSIAISELTNNQIRDSLNWVLVDRLCALRKQMAD